ncbi:MAG: tetratricopeptide repeat protein [Acidobacteriota bacterium]|nr:tetratricopeptide repeat protein [Blastocatellia bacterium]MDW8413541.1 tetratricopeptide repeat protein [Acidobacteriota bacterium]
MIVLVLLVILTGFQADKPLPKKGKKQATQQVEEPHPLVKQIEAAVQNKVLIEPSGTCAFDLYNILRVNVPKEKQLPRLRDLLFENLMKAGSEVLSQYLQGIDRAYKREDWVRSRAYIEKARELRPDDKTARVMDSFYEGMIALSDKDAVRAEKAFRQGLKVDDESAFLYNGLGRALSEQKKDKDSLKAYRKALELAPQWSFPMVNAALKFYKLGDYESARKLAGEALNLNIVDVEAHALLAQLDAAEGRIDTAILTYRQFVIPQRPNSSMDRLFLGRLLMEKGELRAAEQELEIALKLNPLDPKIRMYLSIVKGRIARAEHDSALADLRQALVNSPDDYQTQLAIATAVLDSGNLAAAVDELRKLLQIEPWQTRIRHGLAQLLVRAGRYPEAIDEYKVLLQREFRPRGQNFLRDVHFELAQVCVMADRKGEALQTFRKTLEIDEYFLPARIELAKLLKETGDKQAAILECKQILTLDPSNHAASAMLKELEPTEQPQTP